MKENKSKILSAGERLVKAVGSKMPLIMLLSPVLITVLVLIFGTVRPIHNDDVYLMNMLMHPEYTASCYTTAQSVIFGRLCCALRSVIPAINWYGFFLFLTITASFAAINYCFIRSPYRSLVLVLQVISQLGFFNRFTFTFVAFLGVGAGALLILMRAGSGRRGIITAVLGGLLAFLGAIIRPESAPATLAMAAPLLVMRFAADRKRALPSVIAFAITACFALTLPAGANNAFLSANEREAASAEFSSARSALSDFGLIEYDDDVAAAGFTSNDIVMYKNFLYGDAGVFNTASLSRLKEIERAQYEDGGGVRLTFPAIFSGNGHIKTLAAFYAGLAFALLILRKNRFGALMALGQGMVPPVLHTYLLLCGRGIPRATELMTSIAGINTFFLLAIAALCAGELDDIRDICGVRAESRGILRRIGAAVCCLSMLTVNVFLMGNPTHLFFDSGRERAEYCRDEISRIQQYAEDNGLIYTFTTSASNFVSDASNDIRIVDQTPMQTNLAFGEWYIYSPYWYGEMERIGLGDYTDCAMKAIIDEPMIVIFHWDYEIGMIRLYLSEHYGFESEPEILESFLSDNLYAVRFVPV